MEHDLTGPIPPDTIRISVRYGQMLYVAEFPIERIPFLLQQIEEHGGETIRLARARGTWTGVEGASSIANFAVREEMIELLAASVMWMFANRPDTPQYNRDRERLAALLAEDRGAWLVAVTDENGIDWSFTLSPIELSHHGKAGDPPKTPGDGITVH